MSKAKAATKKSEGMAVIEKLTAAYAARRATLVDRMHALEAELSAIKRKRIAAIRTAVANAADARAALQEALEERKNEFEKPRTRTFHGVKVGFRKLIGKLTWEDGDRVVELIEKHFPERVKLLVKTTKTPVKATLEQLTGAELKKLGCTVGEDTDQVVIDPADSETEKLVDALLEETSADSSEGGGA